MRLTGFIARNFPMGWAKPRIACRRGNCYTARMDWKDNLIESRAQIRQLIMKTNRIAVLGIKTEAQAGQPSVYVPQYLLRAGFEIVPVPVYYPDVTEIFGAKVYRRLIDVPGEIDLVDVFRRPQDIDGHIDDILSKKPKAVWFQSGIRNDPAAEKFARAGIQVVQDRCLMVEHRSMAG
ncbi:MAG TPA: CoA-binding protein [Candidatus Polarisedimenticolaceae bacterium]|nr:CoA-binding protein [Candidatus Polarisedimenticolaceae bacterium]